MDYTAILSRLSGILSGTGGAMAIAAVGVVGIVALHFYRMRFGRTRISRKNKSYRNVVIAPYIGKDGRDPSMAMMPDFPSCGERVQG